MKFWFLLPAVALSALVLTWGLRRYALARSLLDIPNARSSHTIPTPRGGGVAFVLTFLATLLFAVQADFLTWPMAIALLGAGAGVALLGFLDDHQHIAARWRLLGHFAAAAWVLSWIGGAPPLQLPGMTTVGGGWFASAVAAVYLVWLLNLYNFMDGIDGIASLEAICVCIGGAALYALAGKASLAIVPLVLAAAVAGFLYWNFPPARIFMGDAGSGFLGIVMGAFSLQAGWVEPALFWGWLILLGVFVCDATVTLARRLLRGDRVYEAHRSHAYQYASRIYGRHLPVTLAVGAINLAWLFPLALLVGVGILDGLAGVVLAYLPLVVLAVKFRAGEPEAREA